MSEPENKLTVTETKTNLLNFDRAGLEAFFTEMGEKGFRASQVMKWIYQFGVDDFEAMTNLGKALREKLARHAEISVPEIITEQHSADGTSKWLLQLDSGNCVETVFIPEADRGTLCVSSQIGCALECSFCSTAQQGFNRNLTTAEIIGQLVVANRAMQVRPKDARKISNVVMMGMGEPLLNFDNVVRAMNIMMDDYAYGLSRRRVTLSTAGVVPALIRLKEVSNVSLAVSLHAPTDELRNELVPLNRKYPIAELLDACRHYVDAESKRHITFEYVMLDGVNDTPTHARQLVELLRGIPSKMNLIPFNPFPDSHYRSSSRNAIDRFRDVLMQAGIVTVTRRTRGDDIDAACGQLAGKVADRTKRSQRRAAQRGEAHS